MVVVQNKKSFELKGICRISTGFLVYKDYSGLNNSATKAVCARVLPYYKDISMLYKDILIYYIHIH